MSEKSTLAISWQKNYLKIYRYKHIGTYLSIEKDS